MVRNFLTGLIARPPAEPIIILKAPRGTFRAPWDAARAVQTLKERLPSEQLHLDVVVMDGEPTANPKLFGSSPDSSAYVRNVLAELATHTWTPTALDC